MSPHLALAECRGFLWAFFRSGEVPRYVWGEEKSFIYVPLPSIHLVHTACPFPKVTESEHRFVCEVSPAWVCKCVPTGR